MALASAFGWGPDEILELTPSQALAWLALPACEPGADLGSAAGRRFAGPDLLAAAEALRAHGTTEVWHG